MMSLLLVLLADNGHGGTPASERSEQVGVNHAREGTKWPNGHDGIRTHDRRIRSPTLYPN